MNLLAARLYDPAAAVSKSTAALLALTAFDTVNLRNAIVVPPSGMVRVRIVCTIHGAVTSPQIILGVLEGATVRGRQAPVITASNLAATTMYVAEADFVVVGLTPGSVVSWDAAYGVETVVAATNIKYGGPNNVTANDNFGAFSFECWDPCPFYTPAAGAAPTLTAHVKLDAIDDFVDTEVGAIKTKTDQLTFTTANKVDSTIQAAADFAQGAADKTWATAARALTDKAGFALSAAGISAIWDQLLTAITTVGSIGKLLKDNIDAVISTRSTLTGDQAADALLGRNVAGGSSAGRLVKDCFRFIRNRKAIAAGTMTVYQEDDTTSAWTAVVTTAAGNPISEVDPA